MPEYLSPGVYVEEIELGPRPIEGVSTSTAGFLGETLRGPLEPRFITGFEEFKRLYGGFVRTDVESGKANGIGNADLPFAIQGFFVNGGQRCFVCRITPGDALPMTAPAMGGMQITAIGPGVFGNRIAAKITAASLQDPAKPRTFFKLTLVYWDDLPNPLVDPTDPAQIVNPNRREGTIVEVYDNLTDNPSSTGFYETVINGSSSLIRVQHTPGGALPPAIPVLTVLATNGTMGTLPVALADYQGKALPPLPDGTVHKTGLQGFEQVDEIAIVVAPAHHSVPTLTTELITHCTRLKDRFAILHSDPATNTLANINAIRPPQDTTFGAFYFPWIKVFNPLINQDSLVPPSGHIAGIYANTDIERGVFKAPANEVVVGATSLQFQITKGDQDTLNPRGVNCIRIFPSRGIRLWGARTCSTNSLWKYINVRRFFLFLAESIDEGTQWVVFEGNSERLWARVRQTIVQFLTTQWRNGALMGTRPEEAFFVKVDRTTMTQDDIDNGRLICIIGVAPVKPAEFVIFRLAQFQGGTEITEI
ncbi:MAG: phage tail sheath subtilisin-like domain-containing protein [Nitrospira sp.]|jgi:phage tail sheath protein FI|nr:phage tail sheath subtilisin-like domain-containing protein [Nitrospira sp.]